MDYNNEIINLIQKEEQDRKIKNIEKCFVGYENLNLTYEQKLEIFNRSNSYSQAARCKSGADLEIATSLILEANGITFMEQVNVDTNGLTHNNRKNNKTIFRVDFLICPNGFRVGEYVTKDHIILSCKKSLRERANQESCIHHIPKHFFILTNSKDKPKNVTTEIFSTKNKDKNMNHLIHVLKEFEEKFQDRIDILPISSMLRA